MMKTDHFTKPLRGGYTFCLLLFIGFLQTALPVTAFAAPENKYLQQNCPFEIVTTSNGLTVTATLVSPNPALPPVDAKWFLANGVLIGTGPFVMHTFSVPGTYEICVQYEFDGLACHTCTTISLVPNICVDTSLINPGIACSAIFDPVCGCDGNTYENACVALNYHGITSWVPGICAGSDPCTTLIAGFNTTATTQPLQWKFTDQSVMPLGQIVGWFWDFGDGTTSTEQNPSHIYAAPGDYLVCLKVTAISSNAGSPTCTDFHCTTINVSTGCQDHCDFTIGYDLTGNQLLAYLTPVAPDSISPDSIFWSVDNLAISQSNILDYTFPSDGKFVVCAKYLTNSGVGCEVCAVVVAGDENCMNSNLINPGIACPAIFDPVCGCDGETYANACEALNHHGVTSWRKGECVGLTNICAELNINFEAANTGGAPTTWTFDSEVTFPVGAILAFHWDFGNGQTSSLEDPFFNFQIPGAYTVCLTVSASTPNGIFCVATTCQQLVIGLACIDPTLVDPNISCPAVYDPVCGCDGNTYENECVAKFYHGVSSWTPGPCQSACIDPACIDPGVTCPAVYDPVCGCDGITYENACVAVNKYGVTSWKKGVCCIDPCDSLQVIFSWMPHGTDSTLILFQNLSQLPLGTSMELVWTFGEGSTSTVWNPQHQYAQSGEYVVCLKIKITLTNGEICAKEFCQVIKITDGCTDKCPFDIQYQLNSTQLHAWLVSNPANLATPSDIKWFVNSELITTAPTFNYGFLLPGVYNVCAVYTNPDGEICTTCRGIEVSALCINPALIDTTVACITIIMPVCGCDGITYSNACEAEKYHGVSSWTPGPCGSSCNNLVVNFSGFNSGGSLTVWTFNGTAVFPGPATLQWFWDFGNGTTASEQNPTLNFLQPGIYTVCLTVTATNPNGVICTATICKQIVVAAQSCIDSTAIDPNAVCPAIYAPVCGCDGITYVNECEAQKRHGVTAWTPGICADECTNNALADPLVFCPEIFDPVCGCDGQTYENSCVALYNFGITSWEKGPCCKDKTCKAFFTLEILPDNTIVLSDLSEQAESWSLTLGDGTIHYGYFDALKHTYAQPGIYQVCLEISNFAGDCTDKYCTLVDFGTSGVISPSEPIQVLLAPNPAQTQTRISVTGATPTSAMLIGMQGQVLQSVNMAAPVFDLPLAGIPAGIYMVLIQTDRGTVVRKLVVNQ